MSDAVSIETDKQLDVELEDGREGDYLFAGTNDEGDAVNVNGTLKPRI